MDIDVWIFCFRECLRTLAVNKKKLKPLSDLAGNKQIVRTSWYDRNVRLIDIITDFVSFLFLLPSNSHSFTVLITLHRSNHIISGCYCGLFPLMLYEFCVFAVPLSCLPSGIYCISSFDHVLPSFLYVIWLQFFILHNFPFHLFPFAPDFCIVSVEVFASELVPVSTKSVLFLSYLKLTTETQLNLSVLQIMFMTCVSYPFVPCNVLKWSWLCS